VEAETDGVSDVATTEVYKLGHLLAGYEVGGAIVGAVVGVAGLARAAARITADDAVHIESIYVGVEAVGGRHIGEALTGGAGYVGR
jgi:hypothetical protein